MTAKSANVLANRWLWSARRVALLVISTLIVATLVARERSVESDEPQRNSTAILLDKDKEESLALFRKKIEPALKQHCFECHSKDAEEVKGELLLDSREGLRRGGPNGPAVVPGDVEASFLIRSIRYKEDDYKMPPRGRLDDDVIRDFEAWVKSGAEDGR
ncbi:MAG: c-type cytochrome domain-containing protein [Pirellulales bacterium]